MSESITLDDISRALVNDEFLFYYQPIVSLISGRISAAESLIRWKKPDGTIVPPAAFIPLAEESGFITEITRHMLPDVIRDIADIPGQESDFWVSFNVSVKDFQTGDFAETVAAALQAGGLPPRRLRIEITETTFMPAGDKVMDTILALAALDVPIVLNDFSAGYTSLRYLSRLPLAAIKLSLDIVKRAPLSKMDFRVIRHLASMGHQLELETIAEGVEDEEIYDLILSTGCSAAQGFFLGRPKPLDEFKGQLGSQPPPDHFPFGLDYLAQFDLIDFRRDIVREALIIRSSQDSSIRARALARLPRLGYTDCLLGRWYYGPGRSWTADPLYQQLGGEHEAFHRTAEQLLQAAQDNEPVSRIDGLISRLTKESVQITSLLVDLAQRGLTRYFISAP